MTGILYHGSSRRLRILIPKKSFNDQKAIYATNNKKLAIAMGLTNQKGSESFISHDKIKINFVKGKPKMKYVYLYYLDSKNFKKRRKNEYVSKQSVVPIKKERFRTSKLRYLWRKSNKHELTSFLKNRDKWRTPK